MRRWVVDINTVVNRLATGKLRQSTIVTSQCEQLSYPWMWSNLYFDWWPHFKNLSVIVYPNNCKQISLLKESCCCSSYWVVINDTHRIIDYFTVENERVRDLYWFYYPFLYWTIKGAFYATAYWTMMINRIFDMYHSYMSCIIIYLTNFESLICCHWCHVILM